MGNASWGTLMVCWGSDDVGSVPVSVILDATRCVDDWIATSDASLYANNTVTNSMDRVTGRWRPALHDIHLEDRSLLPKRSSDALPNAGLLPGDSNTNTVPDPLEQARSHVKRRMSWIQQKER
jgi:hypothetical protein